MRDNMAVEITAIGTALHRPGQISIADGKVHYAAAGSQVDRH